ncbi:MAG: antibiotic biosynthesis monooxygenase [Chthoniobacterales bacterium]
MEAFDSAGVTGIVWRRVTPGNEPQAEDIMRELMALSRRHEGFLGSEIFPPIPGVQDAYVVLYRFDSGTRLRKWLGCDRRQELLQQMTGLLLEPAKEFFFAHARQRAGTASTVLAYRIRDGREAEFVGWRRRVFAEMQKWEGFLGVESFDTIEDGEPEFIVVVRFDSRPHLDAWLHSPVRQAFLRELNEYVHHFAVRRIGSGFEGWFDISANTSPPARWRQALLILSALFPVIMAMRHLLSPVFELLPLPAAFLILLTLDLAFLTYVVMPHYTRRMNFWLRPTPDATWRGELAGWAVIAGILGVTLCVFLALG